MGLSATQWAWNQHGVTPTEKLTLLALADQVNGSLDCDWLGFKTFTARTGLPRRSVFRALASLGAKKLLEMRKDERGKFLHLCAPALPPPPEDEWVTVTQNAVGQNGTPECQNGTEQCQGGPQMGQNGTADFAHKNGTRAHAEKDPKIQALGYRNDLKTNHSSPQQLSLSGTDVAAASPARPNLEVTVQELVEGWNEHCGRVGLSQVSRITPGRKRKALLRLEENPSQEFWNRTITNIAHSQFCREGRTWCNFDWLVTNDTNAVKAYEGKYNGKNH